MPEPREYRLVWAKPLVKADYENLDPSIQQRVKVQFRKLQEKPELGQSLAHGITEKGVFHGPSGHKMGYDLTGYRSLHFYENKYRIIYQIVEVERKVRIWGIGKRERGRVYRMVHERVRESEL